MFSIPPLPVVRGDAAGDDLTPRSPPARPPRSARLLPHLDSLTGEISSLSPDGIAFTPQSFPREKNTRIAEEQKEQTDPLRRRGLFRGVACASSLMP